VFDGDIYANINKTQHKGMGFIAHYFYCIDSASHISQNATWPHDREIQSSIYGETMAVRCNSKTKHTSNIIELSYGYSENRDNAKCASEKNINAVYRCLHLLSCRQSPIIFETDRMRYETCDYVRC
jgi:hypothetical protein